MLDGADAVVNLCGVPLNHRWTDSYRQLIRESRVLPTELLAKTIARHGGPTLLNQSAVGFYGPRHEEVIDESALVGQTFAAGIAADWEAATAPAREHGVRVVTMRTGLVLGTRGGMLPPVKLVTQLFLGGRLSSGKQYWPWISATDWVDAVFFLIEHPEVDGPVNMVGPRPGAEQGVHRRTGRCVGRPTPWIMPEFALKLVIGDFAEEVVTGQRAVPAKLEDAGFEFAHQTLTEALRAEIAR